MIDFLCQYKKFLFFILDAIILIFVASFSFLIRFEGNVPSSQIHNLKNFILLVLIISLPIFYWQRLYHFTWAYVSINELYRVIKSVTIASLLIATTLFIFRDLKIFSGFPRSIILINYFLTFLITGGWRIAKRIFTETIRQEKKIGRKVLIIGAGEAGEELSRSIIRTRGYNLIGFIDDSELKQNTFIHNYPVLGKRKDIPEIVKKLEIEEIIIAMPSVEPKITRETVEICRQSGIQKIKILPSLREIITGKTSLANVREISIEDLLGRESVKIDTKLIEDFVENKKILVTGAAGSIGSHLCQQILKFNPAKLIALDQNETGIFHLERNLEKKFPEIQKVFEIGDICNKKKMDWLFQTTKPEIVFHAAAYKHVPLMEAHPLEAVKNNVFGTLIVAQTAIKHQVKIFVFISTDKAVNPTSVMGVTKRISEMICQWLNKKNETKFCAVRFGNVLDSQGNVVGIFEEQIKRGGPVEITHPEMKRYFMVTSEACLLVVQAGALSKGGEVFVLDMGQPIKIVDLAKEMIRLAGYKPDINIPIVFVGLRPGEKLSEEILTDSEVPTKHEKIFIAKLQDFDEKKLVEGLEKLKSALAQMNKDGIIKVLKELIPTLQVK